jgi:hypothetical protein
MTTAAPRRPPPAEGSSGTARWLNMVTTLVLGAAALIVGMAAAPSLLRAGALAATDAQEFAPPVRNAGSTIVPGDHPRTRVFDPEEDESRVVGDDDGPPLPRLSPNDPRVRAPRAAGEDAHPGLDELGLPGGVAKRSFSLRDRKTGAPIQEVRAGDRVHVLREDGDWLLVVKTARGEDESVVTGWVKRGELVLR